MIVWILESDSGVKLLYKSFLKIKTDEDIVSGFLTAFNQFSMTEFQQSLESIEMAGLKWVYIMESEYNLLFVAADTKNIKTEILIGRLQAIRKAFIDKFKGLYKKRGKSWDGNINVFLPFLEVIEDYYNQWEEVNILTEVADLYDILRVIQQILIMLRNITINRMYSKSQRIILDQIEKTYNFYMKQKDFKKQPELKNISFSKESWFNLVDIDLVKCDKMLLIEHLKSILIIIVNTLKEVKGKDVCFKYFNEEKIYTYIYNNIKLLQDLNVDMFLLELFLLL